MHRLTALVAVAACSSEPAPSTSYFAEDCDAMIKKLSREAHVLRPWVDRSRHDASAPEGYRHGHYLLLDWYRFENAPNAGGGPMALHVGQFDVQIAGRRDPGERSGRVCGLHIGPSFINYPVAIDFIYTLFEDPELAERVRQRVGPIDPEHPYEIDVMVDGFRIYLAQQSLFLRPPDLEIVIDGCGRVPQHQTTELRLTTPIDFPGRDRSRKTQPATGSADGQAP